MIWPNDKNKMTYKLLIRFKFNLLTTSCLKIPAYSWDINTFASQRHVFDEKNEPFLLENASNLTHEFLYDKFNKKI